MACCLTVTSIEWGDAGVTVPGMATRLRTKSFLITNDYVYFFTWLWCRVVRLFELNGIEMKNWIILSKWCHVYITTQSLMWPQEIRLTLQTKIIKHVLSLIVLIDVFSISHCKLPSVECSNDEATLVQVTWTTVDPDLYVCHHMMSLGHNELSWIHQLIHKHYLPVVI